ncbi:MAG: flagellar biosynthetic protein FliO [Giesbergeria sp.]
MNPSTPTPPAQPSPLAIAQPALAQADERLWSSLLVTALALAFVLALAWLFLRLLKRATTPRSAQGREPPHVVQAVSLGAKERVVILRDGAQEYVLGVTSTQVSLIDKRQARPTTSPSQCGS